MQEKLRDSKGEGKMLRGKRTGLREELESLILKSSQKYKKIISKLKGKVKKERGKIKVKNKEKIKRYKERMESRKKEEEVSSLPEACHNLKNLRVFSGQEIKSETLKEPFISSPEIKLSDAELLILTKSPGFALRNILDKEKFMAEVEKGLIKEQYGRIGKEEENGVIVKDMDEGFQMAGKEIFTN